MKGNDLVKKTAASVALVGFLGSGVWAIEARYAKAADVRELRQEIRTQTDGLKLVILENRLFELKVTQKTRPLTDFEEQHKSELESTIVELKLRIRNAKP